MESVHSTLANSSTNGITYHWVNIYVICCNTVTSICAGYCIIECTTGGNMLPVEVEVFSFAQVSIQCNAYLRVDSQVEVRDRVTSVDRRQFLGIHTSCGSAHSGKHNIFTFANSPIDSVLVLRIDIQCQREDTIAAVLSIEWNSICICFGEASAMAIERITLADGERFVEVVRRVQTQVEFVN